MAEWGRAVVAGALAAALLTAGGGDGWQRGGGRQPGGERAGLRRVTGALVAHRSPLRFQREGVLRDAAGIESVALDGTRVYVNAGDRLTAVDLATGRKVWSVAPALPVMLTRLGITPRQSRPVLVGAGGRRLVVAAFPTSGRGAELLAVDTASGAVAWRAPWETASRYGPMSCTVAAVTASASTPTTASRSRGGRAGAEAWGEGPGVAVVSCNEFLTHHTYGISLGRGHRQVWRRLRFEARHSLAGGRVAGLSYRGTGTGTATDKAADGGPSGRAAALDARTGAVLWATRDRFAEWGWADTLRPFSPHLVMAGPDILDARTGRRRPIPGFAAEHQPVRTCLFDERAHTYCQFVTGELAAYEAFSGRRIWWRGGGSGDDTYPPTLQGAWRGLVYGEESIRAHQVLDGLTGAIRERRAGAAPALVNEFAALEEADHGDYRSPIAALRNID